MCRDLSRGTFRLKLDLAYPKTRTSLYNTGELLVCIESIRSNLSSVKIASCEYYLEVPSGRAYGVGH